MQRWALLQRTGPGKGRIFTLKRPEYLIGRGKEADIQVPDREASRRHALLRVKEKEVELQDLGSANGSFVFGKKVSKAVLRLGDAFTIGQCLFYVCHSEERIKSGTELGVWIIGPLVDLDPVSWRYKAKQKVLEREVELEILRSNFVQDSDLLQHYRHVLRSVAVGDDAGIVPVFDFAEVDGRYVVARRIVQLKPVAWEQFSLKDRSQLIGQFLTVLGRWYEKGVAIPPALERLTVNSEGKPLLRLPCAFDLYIIRKKLHAEYPQFLPFAAPEELLGEGSSGKEESYRIGVLIYRALTGAFPRHARTREEMLKLINEPISDPKRYAPALPKEIVDLLHQLLSRRVEARPEVPEVCRLWNSQIFSFRSPAETRPRRYTIPHRYTAQKTFLEKKIPLSRKVFKAAAFLLLQGGIFFLSAQIVYWLLSLRTHMP